MLQKNAHIQYSDEFIAFHQKKSGLDKCDNAIEHARTRGRWRIAQKLLLHSLGEKLGQQVMNTKFSMSRDRGMVRNMIQIYDRQFMNDADMYATFKRNIIESIILSLTEYKPFSQDLLLIAFRFNYDENGKNNFDDIDLLKVLMETISNVLTPPADKFNFWWFRENILSSSIWFETTENDKYLYEKLMALVDKISMNEQIILKNELLKNIQSESDSKEEEMYWNKLKAFEYQINDNRSSMLRQNAHFGYEQWSKEGLQPLHSLKSLDEQSKSAGINMSQFYDNNIYLDRLMLIAHFIDNEFQRQIKQMMENVNGCKVQRGPLKTIERCLIKTETDYAQCEFPKTAKVLDIVRCSIKFDKSKDLLNGLQHIIDTIESQTTGFKMIARIKNTFSSLSMDCPSYADIKINAVFEYNGYCMLVEVQLMLSSFLKFKKRNHSLYSVSRKKEFYEGLVHLQSVIKPEHSFFSATANGDLKTIYNGIKYDGVDVNSVDDEDNTALFHAARCGNVKTMQTLVANGADVDKQNVAGVTCLYIAADRGYLDMAKYLVLECNAVVNPSGMEKQPLCPAALRGHFDIVKLLTQNGAIITPKALSCARKNYDIFSYLEEHQSAATQ